MQSEPVNVICNGCLFEKLKISAVEKNKRKMKMHSHHCPEIDP